MSGEDLLEKMPLVQQVELLRLFFLYPESTWHLNACGCCVCLHPKGQKHNKDAYIINSDGESSYVTEADL